MSGNILPTSEDIVSAKESLARISGGEMLRNAREAEGLHIAALAVSLKVPVKKLEALETDRFDLLPDIVFVRALAASVCRTLKIDPAPILERLPHTTALRLKTDESGINTPFHSSGNGSRFLFWHQLSKPLVLAIFALLIGVVIIVFFPFTLRTDGESVPKSDIAAVIFPPVTSMTAENSAATEAVTPTPSSDNDTPSLLAPLSINPASMASSPSSSGVPSSLLSVMVPGSGAMTGVVVFKARGSSWVEVIDAKGIVQLRKTMMDSEIVGASGVMPLSVVVGRVDSTEVQVRGQPFDLSRVTKDNVARFEVK